MSESSPRVLCPHVQSGVTASRGLGASRPGAEITGYFKIICLNGPNVTINVPSFNSNFFKNLITKTFITKNEKNCQSCTSEEEEGKLRLSAYTTVLLSLHLSQEELLLNHHT